MIYICWHFRLQRLRQRAQAQTQPPAQSSEGSSAVVPEVNPEFLAALPINIQEEILAQQQAHAAAQGQPDDSMDPATFIQTLPPSLRQSV